MQHTVRVSAKIGIPFQVTSGRDKNHSLVWYRTIDGHVRAIEVDLRFPSSTNAIKHPFVAEILMGHSEKSIAE